jgi:hypothetical protein
MQTVTRPTADDLDVLILMLAEPTLTEAEARRELGLDDDEDAPG